MSYLKKYYRFVITIALGVFLYKQLDIEEISMLFASISWWPVMIAWLLTFLSMPFSAYKWKLLVQCDEMKISLIQLTRIYFLGLFFNNFLPSSMGGDVVRIHQVGRRCNNYQKAAASVIVERLLAAVGLIIPAIVVLLFNLELAEKSVVMPVSFIAVLSLLILLFILLPINMEKWVSRTDNDSWKRKLLNFYQAVTSYHAQKKVVGQVVMLSVIFQLIVVLINYYLFKALNAPVSLWHCLLFIPIISAVSMLPVSVNGLGVRESAYLYFFIKVGVEPTMAVAASLLFFLLVLLVSLIGIFYYINEKVY